MSFDSARSGVRMGYSGTAVVSPWLSARFLVFFEAPIQAETMQEPPHPVNTATGGRATAGMAHARQKSGTLRGHPAVLAPAARRPPSASAPRRRPGSGTAPAPAPG